MAVRNPHDASRLLDQRDFRNQAVWAYWSPLKGQLHMAMTSTTRQGRAGRSNDVRMRSAPEGAPRSFALGGRVRLRLNGRTPREEVIERRVQLFAVQNPRRTLRLARPRERHSQISANELTAHAQNVRDFLGTRMLARTHRDNRIRFGLVFRSHSALLSFGQSAYPIARLKCSANRGAYARLRHQSQRHTMRLIIPLWMSSNVYDRDRVRTQSLMRSIIEHPPRRAPRVESRLASRRVRAQRVDRISRAQIEAACAAGG